MNLEGMDTMAIDNTDAPKRTRRTKKDAAAQATAMTDENVTALDFAEAEAPAESAPKKRGPKKGSTRKTTAKKDAEAAKKSTKAKIAGINVQEKTKYNIPVKTLPS